MEKGKGRGGVPEFAFNFTPKAPESSADSGPIDYPEENINPEDIPF